MRVLMLSLDENLLKPDSQSAKRLAVLGEQLESLDIIVYSRQNFKKVKIADNVFAYTTGTSLKPFYFFQAYKIGASIIKQKRIDIITAQDPFATGLVSWLLTKKYHQALEIQEHGDFFSSPYWKNEKVINFFFYYLGKILIFNADINRVVSQRIKNILINKFKVDSNKITVVPVYSAVSVIENFKLNADFKEVFLSLGRLSKEKNLKLLINSFALVVQKLPKATLVIVGQGPEKANLLRLVNSLRLNNSVVFKNWTEDVASCYQSAGALVLSSNYEGWGRVVIEAVNYHLPVIMTDVGCAGEFIKDGISGLVVPVQDKQALAKAMVKIATNQELAEKFSIAAFQELSQLPDLEKTIELYLSSWHKAIASN